MRAGRLAERITFQRRDDGVDGFGEEQGTWSPIATVWAAVEPIAGREFFASQQTQSDITTRVVCRYSSQVSGITVKDRIQHGGAYYDIRSIINVSSRGRELQLMCTQHAIT